LIWNGFNLQSAMNGQLDLNLIPAFLFGAIDVSQGAASAVWGSGALGGSIRLQDADERGIIAMQEAGSFGLWRSGLRMGWGNARHLVSVSAYHAQNENAFPYRNLSLNGAPLQHQHNAAVRADGAVARYRLILGAYQKLEASVWWQEAARQIPPIMSIPVSVAHQYDRSIRSALNWSYTRGAWMPYARVGWFQEHIVFTDSLLDQHAHNRAQTWSSEAGISWRKAQRHEIRVGGLLSHSAGHSPGFDDSTVTQTRYALFMHWEWRPFHRLEILSSLRSEWNQTVSAPLIPGMATKFRLSRRWLWSGQVSATYRIPTLNDLYWVPGGNPLLLPESGWAAESGLHWETEAKWGSLQAKALVFQGQTQHWILWLPGLSFWSPRNVEMVRNRGVQAGIKGEMHFRKLHLDYASEVQFSETEAQSSSDPLIHSDMQLIYMPQWTGMERLGLTYRKWKFEAIVQHTGLRYVATDHSAWLPANTLLNGMLSYATHLKLTQIRVYGHIQNALNVAYQVMPWRPMPGRSLILGLQIHIHPKPIKTQS
jgi:iron complex outermembrane receptor protein